jgi:hypothetical protein
MLLQFVPYEGYDMRRNLEVAEDARGLYSTDLFTEEAVRIIEEHDYNSSSLFLYLAHLAPHAGNYENPLQAPEDAVGRFSHIGDPSRRKYAGSGERSVLRNIRLDAVWEQQAE